MIDVLDRFLGGGWRYLHDLPRNTLVWLHDSGLWIEFSAEACVSEEAEIGLELARMLNAAVAVGVTGRHSALIRSRYREDLAGVLVRELDMSLVRV